MSIRLLSLFCLSLLLVTGAFAQDMKKEASHGAVTVIVSHEVKDYASWKKVYDADESNRKAGGFKVWGVYADAKNPNMVTLIGTFPNAAAVDGFLSNPKLKEAMEKGGVIGKPDVKVLTAMSK